MARLTGEEAGAFPEPSAKEVIDGYVRRCWDVHAMADKVPCKAISEAGIIRDKPRFEPNFITHATTQVTHEATMRCRQYRCLSKGEGRAAWDEGEANVVPGDTMSVPAGINRSAVPSMIGDVAMFHVAGAGDEAGETWKNRVLTKRNRRTSCKPKLMIGSVR